MDERLLAVLGSGVVEVTVTPFVSVPSAPGLTVTIMLLAAPPDSVGIVQAMLAPRLMQPGDAETKETLFGCRGRAGIGDGEGVSQVLSHCCRIGCRGLADAYISIC